MGERINIQNLVDLLAENKGLNKKDAERFLKEMFNLIEEALEQEKYLKIKGFGTFKLIDVDSRESVNVNTGERIEIQGHTKISFTPETSVRDQINKPFAHFETVILNEGTVFDDLAQVDDYSELNDADSSLTLEDELIAQEIQNEEVCGAIKEINSVVDEEITEPTIDETTEKESISENLPDNGDSITTQSVLDEKAVNEVSTGNASDNSTIDKSNNEIISATKSSNEESIESKPIATETVVDEKASNEDTIDEKVVKEIATENVTPHKVVVENHKNVEEKQDQVSPREVEVDQKEEDEELVERKSPLLEELILSAKAQNNATKNYGRDYTMAYFITVIIFIVVFLGAVFTYIYSPDFVMRILSVPVQEQKIDTAVVTQDSMKSKAIPMVDSLAYKEESIKKDTTNTIITGLDKINASNQPDSTTYIIVGTMEKYTVKPGEGLIKISKHFYESKNLWPYIVKYNPKIRKKPNNVSAGTVLLIPALRNKL